MTCSCCRLTSFIGLLLPKPRHPLLRLSELTTWQVTCLVVHDDP